MSAMIFDFINQFPPGVLFAVYVFSFFGVLVGIALIFNARLR